MVARKRAWGGGPEKERQGGTISQELRNPDYLEGHDPRRNLKDLTSFQLLLSCIVGIVWVVDVGGTLVNLWVECGLDQRTVSPNNDFMRSSSFPEE